jgi:hypothetical protein
MRAIDNGRLRAPERNIGKELATFIKQLEDPCS